MKMIFENKEEYNIFKNAMEKRLGDAARFSHTICEDSGEEFDFKVRFNTEDVRWMICRVDFAKNDSNSFIEERVNNLKEEAKLLDKKIAKLRDENNCGTYKNLINAYSEILRLIERYDWELMYSEYRTDGKKQVAVWEQNGEGIIRNHKVWDIAETAMNNDSNYKIIGVDMSK